MPKIYVWIHFTHITVVGAHIPDLSSEVDFFDVMYLGIFIIFSPAFNPCFYNGLTPSPTNVKEAAYAVCHFCSLLNIFSQWFAIVLEGEVMSHSYVVDRMMGEFSAASVALAKGIDEAVGIEDLEADDRATSTTVREHIEEILWNSYSEVIPYYRHCLDCRHKDFSWTDLNLLILPHSDDFASITAMGEILNLPSYQIYREDLEPIPAPQDNVTAIGKRRVQGGSPNFGDEQAKKHNQKS